MNVSRLDFVGHTLAFGYPPRALRAALLVAVASACTSHGSGPCPPNQPAFRLQLTAEDGVLPPDLRINILYSGALMETYRLVGDTSEHNDLCCRLGVPVNGTLPEVKCPTTLPVARSGHPSRDGALPDAAAGGPSIRDSGTEDASSGDGGLVRDGGGALRDAFASKALDAAAPAGPLAVLCDIWSGGGASVTITASGYVDYERDFIADVPDPQCGVAVVDRRVTLFRPEAGAPQ